MIRYANFYNIADEIELSRDETIKLSPDKRQKKIDNNIINELNSNNKYKIGDIIFTGNDISPFAIIDETSDNKLTFVLNDISVNLPFGPMLSKIKINNIKYQKILDNELGYLRELFINGDEEEIIDEYKKNNIY